MVVSIIDGLCGRFFVQFLHFAAAAAAAAAAWCLVIPGYFIPAAIRGIVATSMFCWW